jgi:hypothetical protein
MSKAERSDAALEAAELLAGGMPLRQYAAIHAALAEGFSIDSVLAHERVDAEAWPDVDEAWAELFMESADGDRALLDQYDQLLREAQDRFQRPIAPLGDDLQAWLDFTRLLGSTSDPLAFLARLEIRPNDVLRLKRIWFERLTQDESARKRVAEILAAPPSALPAIVPATPRMPPPVGASPINAAVISEDEGPERPSPFKPEALAVQTLDITEIVQRLRAMTPKGGLPFNALAAIHASSPPLDGFTPTRTLPEPSPETVTTGEITAAAQEQIRRLAAKPLPFESTPSVSRPPSAASAGAQIGAPEDRAVSTMTFAAAPGPATVLPFIQPQPGAAPDPDDAPTLQSQAPSKASAIVETSGPKSFSITLEQYAELWVELEKAPTSRSEIRARHGLTDDVAWAIMNWEWQERLSRDPALQQHLRELIEQYSREER